MKHLMLIICLLWPFAMVNAGWFSKGPDPLDQAQQKITALETRLTTQSSNLGHWQIISGVLGIGCLLLLIIGTALGSKTRNHYDSTRRLGRTARPSPTPILNGRKSTLLDEEAEDNAHSTLAS